MSCFMGDEDPIKYPCAFPIKIMGRAQEGFSEAVAAVVREHDPAFDPKTLEERPSSGGRYVSLTATVHAVSRAQLDSIYQALTAHPMVKIVI